MQNLPNALQNGEFGLTVNGEPGLPEIFIVSFDIADVAYSKSIFELLLKSFKSLLRFARGFDQNHFIIYIFYNCTMHPVTIFGASLCTLSVKS